MISKKGGPSREAAATIGEAPKRVSSAELLQGARRLLILHDGTEYRLQVTKNGKLLLTK